MLVQWGRAGRPMDQNNENWWTSQDIDGAHIVPAEYIEVLEVVDETSPFGP